MMPDGPRHTRQLHDRLNVQDTAEADVPQGVEDRLPLQRSVAGEQMQVLKDRPDQAVVVVQMQRGQIAAPRTDHLRARPAR